MTIQDVIDSPPGTEFDLSVTEQELNDLAGTMLAAQSGLRLENPQVSLQPGEITVQAGTRFSGIPLTVQVSGTPVVDAGRLRVDVRQMLLNGAPAPVFVQTQVAQQLNEQLAGDALPIEVDSIEVGQGVASIKGRRR